MTMNRFFSAFTLAALLIGTGPAWADSAKLVNPANGHAYQRFDATLTWSAAKAACASKGAHLATLTSRSENSWVYGNFAQGQGDVWLGGTDEAREGDWAWITGEAWAYENWYSSSYPDDSYAGQDYLMFYSGQNGWDDGGGPYQPSEANSYICEWETRLYQDMTAIADMTGDGKGDYALVSVEGGTYRLNLLNSATSKIARNFPIGTTAQITLKSVSVTDDINNNGARDIAVLSTKLDGSSVIQVFDGSTAALLKTINPPR